MTLHIIPLAINSLFLFKASHVKFYGLLSCDACVHATKSYLSANFKKTSIADKYAELQFTSTEYQNKQWKRNTQDKLNLQKYLYGTRWGWLCACISRHFLYLFIHVMHEPFCYYIYLSDAMNLSVFVFSWIFWLYSESNSRFYYLDQIGRTLAIFSWN